MGIEYLPKELLKPESPWSRGAISTHVSPGWKSGVPTPFRIVERPPELVRANRSEPKNATA